MKLLISGDKHLGITTEGEDRLTEQRRICTFCADRSEVDGYIDLGDLFHSSGPSPRVVAEALWYVSAVKAGASFFLVGNHDRPSRGEHHALLPLEASGWELEVVPEPMSREMEAGVFVFLPFVTDWMARQRDHDSAQAWLDSFAGEVVGSAERPIYVFGHVDVDGSEHADERDIGLRVPTVLLEEAAHIWLGHVHKPQTVGENVTIVGSAIVADFGEAEERKGIVEVTL